MLPMSILKLIYNAIISPYISYCNIVWGGTYSSRLNSIRVLQNRAIRIISGNDESLHTPQLYYKTNCLNLFDIHKCKLVYLCIHGLQINFLLFLKIILVIKIKFTLIIHDQPTIYPIHVLG